MRTTHNEDDAQAADAVHVSWWRSPPLVQEATHRAAGPVVGSRHSVPVLGPQVPPRPQ